MAYPNNVIEEIMMGNDIVDVIGENVKLNKRGGAYVGLCPFHKEKTPSFTVNQDKQLYYCFGCHRGGNVITYVKEFYNLEFSDAIKQLAARINYVIPENSYSKEESKKQELRKKIYEVNKIAARYYYDILMSDKGSKADAYLTQRGISPSIRKKFGLGYAPYSKQDLYTYLLDKGFEDETIFESGLVRKFDSGAIFDFFSENRIIFPIIDIYGNVIGFGGRITDNIDSAKYKNSAESLVFSKKHNLYNLNLAKRNNSSKELILVEGYMDVISIYQAGFTNVVASLGTAFRDTHAKVLKKHADSVILLFDSDKSGTDAILKAIPYLRGAGLRVKVVQVTDAKDPDEFIKRFGSSAFGELLRRAKSHIIFQAEQLQKKYDLNLLEDKISFTNEIAKLMNDADNAIEADAYLKEVSKITNIDIASIKSEMNQLDKGISTADISKKITRRANNNGIDDARRSLINIITSHKMVYNLIKGVLKPEYMIDDTYKKVLSIIYSSYDKGEDIKPCDIVGRFENTEEQNKVSHIFVDETAFTTEQLEKALNDQIRQVLKAYYGSLMNNKDNQKDAEISELINKRKEIDSLHISLVKG